MIRKAKTSLTQSQCKFRKILEEWSEYFETHPNSFDESDVLTVRITALTSVFDASTESLNPRSIELAKLTAPALLEEDRSQLTIEQVSGFFLSQFDLIENLAESDSKDSADTLFDKTLDLLDDIFEDPALPEALTGAKSAISSRGAVAAINLRKLDIAEKLLREAEPDVLAKNTDKDHESFIETHLFVRYWLADVYLEQGEQAKAVEQMKFTSKLPEECKTPCAELGRLLADPGMIEKKGVGIETGLALLSKRYRALRLFDELDFALPNFLARTALEQINWHKAIVNGSDSATIRLLGSLESVTENLDEQLSSKQVSSFLFPTSEVNLYELTFLYLAASRIIDRESGNFPEMTRRDLADKFFDIGDSSIAELFFANNRLESAYSLIEGMGEEGVKVATQAIYWLEQGLGNIAGRDELLGYKKEDKIEKWTKMLGSAVERFRKNYGFPPEMDEY